MTAGLPRASDARIDAPLVPQPLAERPSMLWPTPDGHPLSAEQV
jgi:hypothetical protein